MTRAAVIAQAYAELGFLADRMWSTPAIFDPSEFRLGQGQLLPWSPPDEAWPWPVSSRTDISVRSPS